jgi:hypothetical protein
MPRKIQDFAQQSLIRPVLVNVGRAGAANLDVLQVVEYVKQEAKMVYLLECLQKTAPPVIVFSENKNEVDGECCFFVLCSVFCVLCFVLSRVECGELSGCRAVQSVVCRLQCRMGSAENARLCWHVAVATLMPPYVRMPG